MTFAFKAQLNSTNKFVLVALCDNANDQGECYPSVSMLCSKTSLSDRAVQKSLLHLEKVGFIKRDSRRGTSTYYYISNPASWPEDTPEPRSPRTTFTPNSVHPTPEQCSPPPPNVVHPTPEPRSPRTINEPSIESSGKHHKKKSSRESVEFNDLTSEGVDEQTAKDWFAHRKMKKASASKTVLDDRKKQAEIAGISLADALKMEVSRGWQGFRAEWYLNSQPRASPAKPAKFDPNEYVRNNFGRRGCANEPERTIELDERGEPI